MAIDALAPAVTRWSADQTDQAWRWSHKDKEYFLKWTELKY